ncbi:hypothetical protein GJAV_G00170840 [Gymnothorax javanicus]|nr:hypothetical protein GJAV_G00170840 [Gymnothorax javanicus]
MNIYYLGKPLCMTFLKSGRRAVVFCKSALSFLHTERCRSDILQISLQEEVRNATPPTFLRPRVYGSEKGPTPGAGCVSQGCERQSRMEGHCNSTQKDQGPFHGSFELWLLLAIILTALVLSVCWNILCCLDRLCTDRGKTFLPRFRRSLSLRLKDMEDNPIYGNISYTQTRVDLPATSSTTGDQKKMKTASQVSHKRQDCYANLQLKVPKPASGRSSPQIQYSDIVTLPRPQVGAEPEEEPATEPDSTSLLSDLYASVDSQRNKAIANNEEYANQI